MPDDTRLVRLKPREFGVVFNSLNDKRNQLLERGKTTDAIDDVILKIAGAKDRRGRANNEAR